MLSLSFLKIPSFCNIPTCFPIMGTNNFMFFNIRTNRFGYSSKFVKKNQSLRSFCKGEWGNEIDVALNLDLDLDLELENEILEFMKKSEKPGDFPTKDELVLGGRRDLVDAIVRRGGWLSIGWDLDGEFEGDRSEIGENLREFEQGTGEIGEDLRDFDREFEEEKSENGENLRDLDGEFEEEKSENGEDLRDFDESVEKFEGDGSSVSTSSPHSPTVSGRSFEMGDGEEETGVEGILARLEKERNLSLGANVARPPLGRYGADDWLLEGSEDVDDTPKDGIVAISEGSSEVTNENDDNSRSDIRKRLKHLELELAYTLSSLRSRCEKLTAKEGYGISSDMLELSDALEFQETDIMNAKDRLRSIRAKLAVLEGKMTLSIIGSRKTIDEKQRKINSAHRALQLLRTTSVVWPNSASDVFLVGSFDGWTTQRRMKKSDSGMFSVELKLYPGRYEIKFIVDGVWKVDPLRPILNNNGYENNLFIVS